MRWLGPSRASFTVECVIPKKRCLPGNLPMSAGMPVRNRCRSGAQSACMSPPWEPRRAQHALARSLMLSVLAACPLSACAPSQHFPAPPARSHRPSRPSANQQTHDDDPNGPNHHKPCTHRLVGLERYEHQQLHREGHVQQRKLPQVQVVPVWAVHNQPPRPGREGGGTGAGGGGGQPHATHRWLLCRPACLGPAIHKQLMAAQAAASSSTSRATSTPCTSHVHACARGPCCTHAVHPPSLPQVPPCLHLSLRLKARQTLGPTLTSQAVCTVSGWSAGRRPWQWPPGGPAGRCREGRGGEGGRLRVEEGVVQGFDGATRRPSWALQGGGGREGGLSRKHGAV